MGYLQHYILTYKKYTPQINNLSSYFKKLEKEKEMQSKQKEEIVKTRTETRKIENRKTVEKNQ